MTTNDDTRANDPVTASDLEYLSVRLTQAASTLAVLTSCREANSAPKLQDALGLLTDYLENCAKDLSELHRRQEAQS